MALHGGVVPARCNMALTGKRRWAEAGNVERNHGRCRAATGRHQPANGAASQSAEPAGHLTALICAAIKLSRTRLGEGCKRGHGRRVNWRFTCRAGCSDRWICVGPFRSKMFDGCRTNGASAQQRWYPCMPPAGGTAPAKRQRTAVCALLRKPSPCFASQSLTGGAGTSGENSAGNRRVCQLNSKQQAGGRAGRQPLGGPAPEGQRGLL